MDRKAYARGKYECNGFSLTSLTTLTDQPASGVGPALVGGAKPTSDVDSTQTQNPCTARGAACLISAGLPDHESLIDALPTGDVAAENAPAWQSLEDRFEWLARSQYGFDLDALDSFLATGDLLDQDRAHALADRARAFEIYKAGNLPHAMEIIRYLLLIRRAAESFVPAVKAERQRSRAQAGNRAKAAAVSRKYSAEDIDRWKALAALPHLCRHSKRRAAELIAEQLAMPRSAIESIRRNI